MMTNKEIAVFFNQLSSLMELHEVNAFKVKSFKNAYNLLRRVPTPLAEMTYDERGAISGVGKGINDVIASLVEDKPVAEYEEFVAITPKGVVELLTLKGFGPKKIRLLWKELGIETAEAAIAACESQQVRTLKGFGPKTELDLLSKLAYFIASRGKYHYAKLYELALALVDEIVALDATFKVEFTGRLRQVDNTISKIELLLNQPFSDEQYAKLGIAILTKEETFVEAMYMDKFPLHLHIATHDFYQRQLVLSSSSNYLQGVELPTGEDFSSEEAVTSAVGLSYVAPELRDSYPNVVEGVELIEEQDILGVIHAHSTYSDGANTLLDMANQCRSLGYEYLAISDHSKTAVYANGLGVDRVFQQQQEIEQLNATFDDFRIIKSIESDILTDGSLDYDDDVLETFDMVIASVHSSLNMDEAKATKRLLKAIENPYTTVLGHLSGRLLLARKGYPLDYNKIIDACAANNVAIEINANPYRLDIDWRFITQCMEQDVLLSINPDAHNLQGINDVLYGVQVARKGGLTKDYCLSAMSLDEIEEYLEL